MVFLALSQLVKDRTTVLEAEMRIYLTVGIVFLSVLGCDNSNREQHFPTGTSGQPATGETVGDVSQSPAAANGTDDLSDRSRTELGSIQVESPRTINTLNRTKRDRDIAKDEIRFSVVTHCFKIYQSKGEKAANYYFLRFNKDDPSPEFLARFEGHSPRVLPASQAQVLNTPDVFRTKVGVIHKQHGGIGLILTIREIEWISDSKVEVDWIYYRHMLNSSLHTATLQFVNNKWVVTSMRLRVVA